MRPSIKTAFVATSTLVVTRAQTSYFACIFGPDSSGQFHEEVVPESVARACDMFCVCQELKPTCLIGPNSDCNYITLEVEREYAETCDRDQCICTIHDDYISTANARMNDFSLCPADKTPLDGNSADPTESTTTAEGDQQTISTNEEQSTID